MKEHHEHIIEAEDFDKAQEIMKSRCGARSSGRRLGNVGKKFVFSSMLKCGFCGNTAARRQMYSKNHNVTIWHCMQHTNEGKKFCEHSKNCKEEMIKECFLQGYQTLCNSERTNINNFFDEVTKCVRSSSNTDKLAQLNKDLENKKATLKRLVDMMVEGIVDRETYLEKKEHLDNKIEKIENKIEQYSLLKEDDDKIENGLKKIKHLVQTKTLLSEFDEDIFESLIDYIIIGSYEDGKKDEYMIRFICKVKFNHTRRSDITKDYIVENNNIIKGETDNLIPLIDLYANYRFYSFEENGDGKLEKVTRNKVRVRFEVEKTTN